MDKIKEQISALIVFTATELDALDREFIVISKRIDEGVSNMSNSRLYSEKEIKEINSFANSILNVRYRSAKDDIISKKRNEFQF